MKVGVLHDGARGIAEHIFQAEVDRAGAVALGKDKPHVARSLAHHIHRCALPFGDAPHAGGILLLNQQAHALLALVANHLACGEGRIADR